MTTSGPMSEERLAEIEAPGGEWNGDTVMELLAEVKRQREIILGDHHVVAARNRSIDLIRIIVALETVLRDWVDLVDIDANRGAAALLMRDRARALLLEVH